MPIYSVIPAFVMLIVSTGFAQTNLTWNRLPPLPNGEGFAGAFAGVTDGALLVAGGANFPGQKPWEGGTKVWHDDVFLLETGKRWKRVGKLPRPLAYGVSVTFSNRVICIGGSDAVRHYSDVFALSSTESGRILQIRRLPPLPLPCANMCGALVGSRVYIAGGIVIPSATNALRTFWSLDLAAAKMVWEKHDAWPGIGRMLAVAGTDGHHFYLFSGASLYPGTDGKVTRNYLRDGYRYGPSNGWTPLKELPRAAVAAPSPAPLIGSKFLVISGDDGSLAGTPPSPKHPGFPRDMLAFDTNRLSWTNLAVAAPSRATVPTVAWLGKQVIPSGETRPGIRTPEVWTLLSE